MDPYVKQVTYANYTFQTDVLKLSDAELEYVKDNTARLIRYRNAAVDKLNGGDTATATWTRSDKLSQAEQLKIIRDVLDIFGLPDIVPDNLEATKLPGYSDVHGGIIISRGLLENGVDRISKPVLKKSPDKMTPNERQKYEERLSRYNPDDEKKIQSVYETF